ncbi:MAG: repressor LexA [Clostridiales bacterium]|nr:repressor LexA [Clostridiales bacterium]
MRSKDKILMTKMIEFIDSQYQNYGEIPTFREIAKEFNISSGCVSNYITEMREKGLLQSSTKSRSIRTTTMTKTNNSMDLVPIVGAIACGTPLLAEENIEKYIPISHEILGNGKFFILRACGDSMIKAGINNGDLVVIKQQENAEEGQIVVALIESEATLKRYYIDKKKRKVRLHPENDNMEDLYFDNIIIQGIAVKVIKDLF